MNLSKVRVGRSPLVRKGTVRFQDASYSSQAGLPLSLLNNRALGGFGKYIELEMVETVDLLSELSCETKGVNNSRA